MMKTGIIDRALLMTWFVGPFELTSLPVLTPCPPRKLIMYKAALICISCPQGEIVMAGPGHRIVLTLLILLTGSIALYCNGL